MYEKYVTGDFIDFKHDKLRVYMETTLSLSQKLEFYKPSDSLVIFSEDPNWMYAKLGNKKEYDILLRIVYDKTVAYDGYILKISKEKIQLNVSENRAILFGLKKLESLYIDKKLYTGVYKEIPTIKYRGIIEGFYGIPWSHEDRLDAISFLQEHRFNTYFYAPKDDIYHREFWREPYPEVEQSKIEHLIKKAESKMIDFVYCISPGKDILLTDQSDVLKVVDKLLDISKLGVRKFALLMDDINYELNQEETIAFKTPGVAHSVLANNVYKQLKDKVMNVEFYVCPTEYWQNWDTPYRNDMKNTLDQEIVVFFTGYHTIAKTIPKEDIDIAYNSFGHKLAIWDNYPTNDVNKDRLYLGPIVNRSKELNNSQVSCYLSNPMNQWNMSKIPLMTLSDYLWHSLAYNEDYSHVKSIKEMSELWEVGLEELKHFVYLNASTRLRTIDYFNDINKLMSSKKNLELFYNKGLKTLDAMKKSNISNEINSWTKVLEEELKYMKFFLDNKKCDLKERKFNLGFNFGTMLQNRMEEDYE